MNICGLAGGHNWGTTHGKGGMLAVPWIISGGLYGSTMYGLVGATIPLRTITGERYFLLLLLFLYFGWGNTYSATGQPLFNHFYFHIPLGNWFLCDVMASNSIPIFTVNWSSRVVLKVHVTYGESVGGDEQGQDHF